MIAVASVEAAGGASKGGAVVMSEVASGGAASGGAAVGAARFSAAGGAGEERARGGSIPEHRHRPGAALDCAEACFPL
eukprot:4406471-Prymnesium_polylepis.1